MAALLASCVLHHLQDKQKLEKARAREAAAVRAAAEAHQQQAAAALAGKKPTIQRNKYVHPYRHALMLSVVFCYHGAGGTSCAHWLMHNRQTKRQAGQ
jgi:hypothetical protein